MTITEIQNLSEDQVKTIAERCEEIKGHNVYFVNIDGAFGYSYLVFRNGMSIHYANDYELHHSNKTREELDELYHKSLACKLFEDSDFAKSFRTYSDYRQRINYLHNYYAMQVPHMSIFGIFHNKQEEEEYKAKIANMCYDPIGFCYVDDKEFVKKHVKLFEDLNKTYQKRLENYEFLKRMFKYEMANHEYQINTYQGNWDVLTCIFGDTKYNDYDDYEKYFEQLGLTEVQRKAYRDARHEYLKNCKYY